MTRRRTLLLLIAFAAGGFAALHFYDPPIEPEAAAALADRLAGEYRQQ